MTAEPWPIGAKVRLATPENPAHPRAGRVGVVVEARFFGPKTQLWKGKFVMIDPGGWLVRVRFDREGDAFDFSWRFGPLPSVWNLMGEELVLVADP